MPARTLRISSAIRSMEVPHWYRRKMGEARLPGLHSPHFAKLSGRLHRECCFLKYDWRWTFASSPAALHFLQNHTYKFLTSKFYHLSVLIYVAFWLSYIIYVLMFLYHEISTFCKFIILFYKILIINEEKKKTGIWFTEKIPCYNPVNSKRSLYNKEKAQKTAHYLLELFSALRKQKGCRAADNNCILPCNSPVFLFYISVLCQMIRNFSDESDTGEVPPVLVSIFSYLLSLRTAVLVYHSTWSYSCRSGCPGCQILPSWSPALIGYFKLYKQRCLYCKYVSVVRTNLYHLILFYEFQCITDGLVVQCDLIISLVFMK